jgi:hypothetical protein
MSNTTDISDIDTAEAVKPAKRATKSQAAEGRKMVTIHPGNESDGMAPVKIGVNGDMLLVPRNVPCALPEEAIEVLRNAVYTEYREVNGEYQPHHRQRFSFTIEA